MSKWAGVGGWVEVVVVNLAAHHPTLSCLLPPPLDQITAGSLLPFKAPVLRGTVLDICAQRGRLEASCACGLPAQAVDPAPHLFCPCLLSLPPPCRCWRCTRPTPTRSAGAMAAPWHVHTAALPACVSRRSWTRGTTCA